MANSVLAQLLRKQNYDYDCLHQESIPCDNAVTEGIYWRIPRTRNGVLAGYDYRADKGTKPTPDSMKALRVNDRVSNIIYYVAIADNAGATVFTDMCNACCDTVDPLPTVAFPTIIIEEEGCPDGNGNFNYSAFVDPTPEANQVYKLSGSQNGVALPAAPAEGFVSLAALETWADTNWNGQGTVTGVTLNGGQVILNGGAGTKSGSINVEIDSFLESNAPGALTSGQHYHVVSTINGESLPVLDGVADAALSTLATAANASAPHAKYGVWSVTGGKLRVVSKGVVLQTGSIVITKV